MTRWAPTVRLHRSSEGSNPGDLVPGRDVVLSAPVAHGVDLPMGVLLDDHLDQRTRAAIDAEALRRQDDWLRSVRPGLTVRGVMVADIWWNELLAEVFLPETRAITGLATVFTRDRPARLECHGVDRRFVECLRRSLDRPVVVAGAEGPAPRYPSPQAVPRPARRWAAALRLVFDVTGIPGTARGAIVLLPYWHLLPFAEELIEHGMAPSVVLERMPALPRRRLVRMLIAGGWLPHAGRRRRLRSRRATKAALRALAERGGDALDALCHARATSMLEQRSLDTVALVDAYRAGLRRARLMVLPFDSMPDGRMLVQAARDVGVPVLVVQHGFYGEPNEPDKALADHIAVWSEHDAEQVSRRVPGSVVLTGNPGTSAAARAPWRRAPRRDTTLVLVQDASRHSTRADTRVGLRHVRAALDALQRARRGTAVILRPHPAEPSPEAFLRLSDRHAGLRVALDSTSPIEALIERSDLCIGAVSTATLQAGVAGVPVVLLNADRIPRLWPFDGSTDLPIAYDADRLAQLIPELLEDDTVRGRDTMRAALGLRVDALDRLLRFSESLVTDQPANSRSSKP